MPLPPFPDVSGIMGSAFSTMSNAVTAAQSEINSAIDISSSQGIDAEAMTVMAEMTLENQITEFKMEEIKLPDLPADALSNITGGLSKVKQNLGSLSIDTLKNRIPKGATLNLPNMGTVAIPPVPNLGISLPRLEDIKMPTIPPVTMPNFGNMIPTPVLGGTMGNLVQGMMSGGLNALNASMNKARSLLEFAGKGANEVAGLISESMSEVDGILESQLANLETAVEEATTAMKTQETAIMSQMETMKSSMESLQSSIDAASASIPPFS